MRLVLLGASDANAARIAGAASSRGIRVVRGEVPGRADWAIVASADQRDDVLARLRLPAFRVVEWPDIAGPGAIDLEIMASGLARMSELGPHRPPASPAGIALARWLLPRIMPALERALAGGSTEVEEPPLPDRPAVTAEARRKAERKEARRADKLARHLGRQPISDPPARRTR